jgi:hypothetical protein
MDTIEVGTVLRLNDGTTAVVVQITIAPPLGIFYSVMVADEVREISKSQIAQIVNEVDDK